MLSVFATLTISSCTQAQVAAFDRPPLRYELMDELRTDAFLQRPAVLESDEDGNVELVVPSVSPDLLFALEVEDGGDLDSRPLVEEVNNPRIVASADLDKDGQVDIVTVHGDLGEVWVWLSTADGSIGPPSQLADTARISPRDVVLADVDGDGRTDIIGATEYSDVAVFVWRNTGRDWARSIPTTRKVLGGCRAPTAVDLDSDGLPDVVCGMDNSRGLAVLRGRPGRLLAATEYTLPGTDLYVSGMAPGDFHGTGTDQLALAGGNRRDFADLDLWTASVDDRHVSPLAKIGFPAVGIVSADLDGDGIDDLIASSYSGPVVVLRSRGGGAWDPPVELLSHVDSLAWPVVVDIDGSPPLDLVVVDNASGRISSFVGSPEG